MSRTLAIVLLIPCLHVFADRATLADPPSVIADFEDYLVIEPVGRGGRSPVHTDAIEATIVDGSWRTPEPGDAVRIGRVPRIWQSASAGEDGWLTDDALRGGYAVATIERDAAGPAILEARGHSMVYVNGAPRPGDPYANGSLRLPVMLEAGENEFLFKVGRGRVKARLVDVPRTDDGDPKTFFFTKADDTIPNAVVGTPLDAFAGVVIANIGTDWMPNRSILVTGPGGETATSAMPAIAPGSVRKVPIRLVSGAVETPGVEAFRVEIVDPGSIEPVDVRTLDVKAVEPTAARRVTFRSEHRRFGPVLRTRPKHRGSPRRRSLGGARTHPDAPRRRRRRPPPGRRLRTQGLRPRRGADQPAQVRVRLGGLGSPRRDGSARPRSTNTRHRSESPVGHRTFHGWTRNLAGRGSLSGSIRGGRPERRLDRVPHLRGRPHRRERRTPFDRVDHGPRRQPQRHASAPRQSRRTRDLRPARRCRRQRPRRSGPHHATIARGVAPGLRLSRGTGRRTLVGESLRRLAAADPVPRGTFPRSESGPGAIHHRLAGHQPRRRLVPDRPAAARERAIPRRRNPERRRGVASTSSPRTWPASNSISTIECPPGRW